ncbi:MAG: hypothetical protein KAT16_05995 [Candidatus Heimdallarchaeota archaeon]|nr:hypothetical protein [Candidatus Heimdallarchaeota archaeon]
MKKILFGLILFILLVSAQNYRITSTQSHNKEQRVSAIVSLTGSFSLDNTSESKTLVGGDGIIGSQIGETWDLTIDVHSNSTTNINFSMSTYIPQWWEGTKTFILNPNQTHTESFVLHCITDIIGHMSLDFLYELVESEKAVSGTYYLKKVNVGYPYSGFLTGPIYVSNITEWISSNSSTNSIPESNSTDGFMIGVVIVGLLLLYRRKLGKKKLIGR